MPPKRKVPCPSSESQEVSGLKRARAATVDIVDQDTDSVPGTPEADIQDTPPIVPEPTSEHPTTEDPILAIGVELQILNQTLSEVLWMLRCDEAEVPVRTLSEALSGPPLTKEWSGPETDGVPSFTPQPRSLQRSAPLRSMPHISLQPATPFSRGNFPSGKSVMQPKSPTAAKSMQSL